MSDTRILSDSISSKIKELIRNGNLQPGQQIPNEQSLIDMLHVSRSTVREAVKILASKNILEIKRGKGTYVCMVPGIDSDPFGFDFLDKGTLIASLCELRTILEPQVAVLATQRATKDELEEMRKIVDELESLYGKTDSTIPIQLLIDELSDKDMEFHNHLYKMAHNPALNRIIPAINKAILENYTDVVFRRSYREHRHISTHKKIYDAMAMGDQQLVYDLCKQHMENGTKLLLGKI